jgi:hypothetical protein
MPNHPKKTSPRRHIGDPNQTPAEDRVELNNMRKWQKDDEKRHPMRNQVRGSKRT